MLYFLTTVQTLSVFLEGYFFLDKAFFGGKLLCRNALQLNRNLIKFARQFKRDILDKTFDVVRV